jgi:hypothetical protein
MDSDSGGQSDFEVLCNVFNQDAEQFMSDRWLVRRTGQMIHGRCEEQDKKDLGRDVGPLWDSLDAC